MFNITKKSMEWGGRTLTLETGRMARQADGAVLAMVGGRSYVESQFNRAAQAQRQPGSAFKPIVFLAALEAGYTPQSPVTDEPVSMGGWTPRNASTRDWGTVSLAGALSNSINTLTVQIGDKVGILEIGTEQVGAAQLRASQRTVRKSRARQHGIVEHRAIEAQAGILAAGLLQTAAPRPAGKKSRVPGQYDLNIVGR